LRVLKVVLLGGRIRMAHKSPCYFDVKAFIPYLDKLSESLNENDSAFYKELTKMPKLKKFYVGSPTVYANGWAKMTLEEAIKQAKELCEEREETQYVVKVVAVIKRREQPVVVEMVK
jgi:exo-beta-1,3-glucanase (GH17 family)